ncbi:MAG: succinate dehydrogenase, hydrophobic membrane anchor protein [Gammaproteobacteria bacterium]|nr:succinate dehydrogenase, hydrophobic membrane anchor protein [Gammaproteobacteria bacterium]
MGFRSPLGRAIGSGSARSGFEHWWGQRLSAAGLGLLGLWFVISIAGIGAADHATVAAWIGSMPHAILLILLVMTLLYHSNLGVNVVLEDYVHDGRALVLALGLVRFAHVAMAVAGIYSIVSLSLGARA